MKVVDLNVLLYAVNRDSPRHADARTWLENVLGGEETIALPWVVLLGFLRISTSPHILPRPISIEQAIDVATSWLDQPPVIVLSPGEEHWRILTELLAETGSAGNLTTDAHLASLAIEHGAELCSTDGDFARFRHLRWVNPLAES